MTCIGTLPGGQAEPLSKRRYAGGRGLAALAIAGTLIACNAPVGSRMGDQAEATAREWLTALVDTDSHDRGWSLLRAGTQEIAYANDVGAYLADVEAARWEAFEWAILPETRWDGVFQVTISVDGGAIPDFLLARRLMQRLGEGRALVLLRTDGGPPGIHVPGAGPVSAGGPATLLNRRS